jgi:hypothetical protein
MKSVSRSLRSLSVALASLLTCAAASAYVITAEAVPQTVGGPPYSNVGNPIGTLTGGTVGAMWTAVEYRKQLSGGSTLNTNFDSWCVEPLVQDSAGPWTYNVSDLDGSGEFDNAVEKALGRLWSVADASAGSAPTISTTTGASALPNSTLYATAFQIALWELVTDGISWDLSAGSSRLAPVTAGDAFTNNVRLLAESWLIATFAKDLTGAYTAPQSRLEYLDTPLSANGKGQDRIRLFVPGQNGDPSLPVPSMVLLLGVGLVAMSLRKRT